MRKSKLLLGGIIMAISITSLISCGNTNKNAASKIVEELNKRYNKSFVVDSIGNSWGTADNTTIKAWCYEENNKDEMFKAAIKKDFSEVTDEYQALMIEKKLEISLKPMLDSIFGEVFININLGNVMTSNNIQYTDLSEYFKDNEYAVCSLNIFVKTCDDINKAEEVYKISEFLNLYRDLSYSTNGISVYYVKEEVFNNIYSEYEKIDNDYEYYGPKENCYNNLWFEFEEKNKLYISTDEILSSFEW